MTREPVLSVAGIVAVLQALIALLLGFNVIHWTADQVGLVLGAAGAVLTMAAALFARSRVTPVTP
jgi:2-methylisocitrate lyase-like PEP mutase family enzyme